MPDLFSWPYAVWKELGVSRNYVGDAPSGIAFTDVACYGAIHSCSKSDIISLWDDVSAIDKAWRSEVAKIAESQDGSK